MIGCFPCFAASKPLQAGSVEPSMLSGTPHLGRKLCDQRLPFTLHKRISLVLSTGAGQPDWRQCTHTTKASSREHQCGAPALLRLLALALAAQSVVVLPACTIQFRIYGVDVSVWSCQKRLVCSCRRASCRACT